MGDNNDSGREIVERIDEILKRKNLKRQALADSTGISTQSISHWSKRRSIPAAGIVLKMADYLEVSVRYLVTGETEHGISQDIIDMAYEIAALDTVDQNIIKQSLSAMKDRYLQTEKQIEGA